MIRVTIGVAGSLGGRLGRHAARGAGRRRRAARGAGRRGRRAAGRAGPADRGAGHPARAGRAPGCTCTRRRPTSTAPGPTSARSWPAPRSPTAVRDGALAVFERLAVAEGRVHRVPPDDVHFHEVGALDALADVVGRGRRVRAPGPRPARRLAGGAGQRLGARRARRRPDPRPGGAGAAGRGPGARRAGAAEMCTPTGAALRRRARDGLVARCPPMRVRRVGIGRRRPGPGRAAQRRPAGAGRARGRRGRPAGPVVLEANVDDLDPRLWPGVLDALFAAGASDAWLTPILMKKGRPAHTLSVLCAPEAVPTVQAAVFAHDLDDRAAGACPWARSRWSATHGVGRGARRPGGREGRRTGGRVVNVSVEYEDVAALARATGPAGQGGRCAPRPRRPRRPTRCGGAERTQAESGANRACPRPSGPRRLAPPAGPALRRAGALRRLDGGARAVRASASCRGTCCTRAWPGSWAGRSAPWSSLVGALVLLAWIPLRERPGWARSATSWSSALAVDAALAVSCRRRRAGRPDRASPRPASLLQRRRHRRLHRRAPRPRTAGRADDRAGAAHRRVGRLVRHAHRGGRRRHRLAARRDRSAWRTVLYALAIGPLVHAAAPPAVGAPPPGRHEAAPAAADLPVTGRSIRWPEAGGHHRDDGEDERPRSPHAPERPGGEDQQRGQLDADARPPR